MEIILEGYSPGVELSSSAPVFFHNLVIVLNMLNQNDRNIHRPIHVYLDDEIYFVSCRTTRGKKYFKGDLKKYISESIFLAMKKYDAKLFSWVVLENHYHLLFELPRGKDLGKIIRFINGRSAKLLLKRHDGVSPALPGEAGRTRCVNVDCGKFIVTKPEEKYWHDGASSSVTVTKPEASSSQFSQLKIWYQYWDWIIRNEKDFYTHLNYIHENPIKHGLVKNLEKLANYQFCSYKEWLDKFGEEAMGDIIRIYPVADYSAWDN